MALSIKPIANKCKFNINTPYSNSIPRFLTLKLSEFIYMVRFITIDYIVAELKVVI